MKFGQCYDLAVSMKRLIASVATIALFFASQISSANAKEFSRSVTFEKLNYQGQYTWPVDSILGHPLGMWCWDGTCGYGLEKSTSPTNATPLPVFDASAAPGVQTTVKMFGKIAPRATIDFQVVQQFQEVSAWMLYRNQNIKNAGSKSKISNLAFYSRTQIRIKCFTKSKVESDFFFLSYQPVGNSKYDDLYWKNSIRDHVRSFDVAELYSRFGKTIREVQLATGPSEKLLFTTPNNCRHLSIMLEPNLMLAANSVNPLSYEDPLKTNSRWILPERIARVSLDSLENAKLENYFYHFNVLKGKQCPKSKLFCA
jgi:hypothetical protein